MSTEMSESEWTLTVTAGRSGDVTLWHVTTSSGDIQSFSSLAGAKRAVSSFLTYQHKYGRWVERV